MSVPVRIQRLRTKGWRKPPNTLYVGRPGLFGNPFDWRDGIDIGSEAWAKAAAVELYREWLRSGGKSYSFSILPPTERQIRELKGKNLCCWCRIDQPCHADILLKLANE